MIDPQGSVAIDYNPKFPAAPPSILATPETVATWDVSSWDLDDWATDDTSYQVYAKWRGLAGTGFAFAPQIQMTSGNATRISATLERVDLSYTAGSAVT